MRWSDEGIVLAIKRHGESNAIAELMTREHGRHLGLVRGGAGSRLVFARDLAACVATGEASDLIYVSPKSGRAVSRQAGEPWKQKLLPLPAFLAQSSAVEVSSDDLADAFALTGFFLLRHVLEPR